RAAWRRPPLPFLPETFDDSFSFLSDCRLSHPTRALRSWPDENLGKEIFRIGVNGNTNAALREQWIENAGTVSRAFHPSFNGLVGRLLHPTFTIDILAAADPPDTGSAQPCR